MSKLYPRYWLVEPATNRFEAVLVGFDNSPYSYASVQNGTLDSFQKTPVDAAKAYSVLGYSIFQNAECVKYKVEGNKACSVILTGKGFAPGEVPSVILQIFSSVNGNMYGFLMKGTQDNFDSYLPTFQKMIASFRS